MTTHITTIAISSFLTVKYPISIQTFETIIEDHYLYADKTDLVYDLAQEHVCFLARPRRFGKSLLISTLEAYFRGQSQLFKNLKLETLEHNWTQYPVFHIDFANGDFTQSDGLEKQLEIYLSAWEQIYGKPATLQPPSIRFQHLLESAYTQTGHKAVVLIDEYDKPLLDAMDLPHLETNRNTLRSFFGTFKAADASIRFALLTGVTKFRLPDLEEIALVHLPFSDSLKKNPLPMGESLIRSTLNSLFAGDGHQGSFVQDESVLC